MEMCIRDREGTAAIYNTYAAAGGFIEAQFCDIQDDEDRTAAL